MRTLTCYGFTFILFLFSGQVGLAAGCDEAVPAKSELSQYEGLDPKGKCSELEKAQLDKQSGVVDGQCNSSVCVETYDQIKTIALDYKKELGVTASKVQAKCHSCVNTDPKNADSQKRYFQCLLEIERDVVRPELVRLNKLLETAKGRIQTLEDANQKIAEQYLKDKSQIEEAISQTEKEIVAAKTDAMQAPNPGVRNELLMEASALEKKKAEAAGVSAGDLITPNAGEVAAKNGGVERVKQYAEIASNLNKIQMAAADQASESKGAIQDATAANQSKIQESARRQQSYEASLKSVNTAGASRVSDPAAGKGGATGAGAFAGANPGNGNLAGDSPAAVAQQPAGSNLGDTMGKMAGAAGALGAGNPPGATGESPVSMLSAGMPGGTIAGDAVKSSGSASKIGGSVTAVAKDLSKASVDSSALPENAISFNVPGSSGTKKRAYNRSGSSSAPSGASVNGAGGGGVGEYSNKDMPRDLASAKLSPKDQLAASVGGGLDSGSADLGLSSFDASGTDLEGLLGDNKKVSADGLAGLSDEERKALGLDSEDGMQSKAENSVLGMESESLFLRTRSTHARAMKRGWVMDNIHMKGLLK